MRHAPCPVLIVQHPEHEFVVEDESEAARDEIAAGLRRSR
jgi:hypothetical protein